MIELRGKSQRVLDLGLPSRRGHDNGNRTKGGKARE
jgi:hypothetical protein